MSDYELPPLPEPRLIGGIGDYREYWDADQMREYGRAVERAAYERAAKECELQITGSDYHFLATHGHWDHMAQAATNCAAAIRALGEQHD